MPLQKFELRFRHKLVCGLVSHHSREATPSVRSL